MEPTLSELTAILRQFRDERDWAQFHTPRNLATALSVEAAELLEPFQWLAGEAELTPEARQAVTAEMADVLSYLLLLADRMQVDLADALQAKVRTNAEKYPADQVRGSSRKYDQY
ncbi:MAG TPA: nucleotide pyrophosphohydrolase [Telluria sp.]|nr:nucleotide pyrophosphohydrolase [Telluria sp.]